MSNTIETSSESVKDTFGINQEGKTTIEILTVKAGIKNEKTGFKTPILLGCDCPEYLLTDEVIACEADCHEPSILSTNTPYTLSGVALQLNAQTLPNVDEDGEVEPEKVQVSVTLTPSTVAKLASYLPVSHILGVARTKISDITRYDSTPVPTATDLASLVLMQSVSEVLADLIGGSRHDALTPEQFAKPYKTKEVYRT